VSAVSITAGFDSDLNPAAAPVFPGTTNRAPGGHLTIPAGVVVDVGDGGSFSFSGKSAEIDGKLVAPGGKVSLSAMQFGGDAEQAMTVHLGTAGVIDVAGRWTNDSLGGSTGPVRALDGGSVKLTGETVRLDPGSLVDVSGGGRLDATGTKVTAGNAGSVSIDVSQYPSGLGDPNTIITEPFVGTLALGGLLDGRAMGKGG
jgi:hypothetical protein